MLFRNRVLKFNAFFRLSKAATYGKFLWFPLHFYKKVYVPLWKLYLHIKSPVKVLDVNKNVIFSKETSSSREFPGVDFSAYDDPVGTFSSLKGLLTRVKLRLMDRALPPIYMFYTYLGSVFQAKNSLEPHRDSVVQKMQWFAWRIKSFKMH